MTIEVRQLIVKSTVVEGSRPIANQNSAALDTEELKAEILAECKDLLIELLRDQEER